MPKTGAGAMLSAGAYVADKPVCGIIRQAAEDAVTAAGFGSEKPDGRFLLSGTLIELKFSAMVGFMRCLVSGRMEMALSLRRPGGNALWSDRIIASGRSGSGALVANAFSGILDDFVLQLVSRPGLWAACKAD
jgi:hypothetical protein